MNTIRVSLVEDDAELRGTLKEFIMSSEGLCFVSDYGTAEAALKNLPADCPDVVMMDIRLPGISGIECVGALKSILPSVKILMLTVFEDGDQLFHAIASGASGYLLKSTDPERVVTAIREVFAGGPPITSSVARKMVDFFRVIHPASPAAETLSSREEATLKLLAEGLMYKEIADRLGVSTGSVRTYLHRVYEKLHVTNRTEAVLRYYFKRDAKT